MQQQTYSSHPGPSWPADPFGQSQRELKGELKQSDCFVRLFFAASFFSDIVEQQGRK